MFYSNLLPSNSNYSFVQFFQAIIIHEAIIRQNLIHSPGYGLFATPGNLNGNDIVEFNIEWNNISDSQKTISDYGLGKSLKFKATPIELYSAVYAAGDLRIYKIVDQKNRVYLSLHGQFDLKDQEISSYINKIIKGQRAFSMIMIFLII